MFATVTIQTYNHAKTLAKTLESLRTLRCPKDVDYEILIVNNNSADNTPDVIECYAKILAPRFRSVFESRQGLSHARNRALQEARGEIVCFLDDDVKVDPGWLEAVSAAFIKYSAAVVGGKSYLIYTQEKPVWLTERYESYLSRLDYGDTALVNTDKDFYGLNFSVLRKAAIEAGGFDTNLGRKGKSLGSGEEIDLQNRIVANGGVAVYEPEAVVGHIVTSERLEKRWFLQRVFKQGVFERRLNRINGDSSKIAYFLWRTIRCYGGIIKSMIVRDCNEIERFHKWFLASKFLGCLFEDFAFFLDKQFVHDTRKNILS